MTDQTPIERAAEALVNAAFGRELPEAPIDLAKAVFESIDTNQLADVIAQRNHDPNIGQPWEVSAALAIKDWLTGKDQQ